MARPHADRVAIVDRRRRCLLAAGSALPFVAAAPSSAQSYPDHAVKLTVGFPPGTGPDTVARVLGQKLAEIFKQSVVVDNRAGAGGQIAVQAVVTSQPDGYNLLLAEVGSISIAPAAFSKLGYDPGRDLVAVSEVARSDFLLVVPNRSSSRTVADFVAAARARTDRTNFATFGAGTPGHFGAELFATEGGFKIEPIHYRSTGDAVSAIVAGDVEGTFVSIALGSAQTKGGKMRALATTATERTPLLPEVPTFTEAGMPKVDFAAWFAIFVPAKTPGTVIEPLERALLAAARDPQVSQKLAEAGLRSTGTSRAETGKMVKDETQRWAAIVKATGFKGD
jgi:tripartite-type tricarboxylate transporter receptor subunit TctC